MDYELAKKLKEKGFPQATGGFYYWNRDLMEACDINPFYNEKIVTHTIKIPKLSELIEEVRSVPKGKNMGLYENGNGFVAWKRVTYENDGDDYAGEGKTPEEAVANLWLELNNK